MRGYGYGYGYGFIQYWIIKYPQYIKWRKQAQLFVASSQSIRKLFKIPKEPKLAQLVKVLYNWGTAMYSKEKPMTGL
jgi:hypothetical protein